MRLSIAHTTTYAYDLSFCGDTYMEARLRPLTAAGQQACHEFRLSTQPESPVFEYGLSGEGGSVSHFTVKDLGHDRLVIRAESIVETMLGNPFETVELGATDWDRLADPDLRNAQAEWLGPTGLTRYDGDLGLPNLPREGVFEFGQALTAFIHGQFEYVPGSTDVSTPLETVVRQRRGVCQDYAHFMIAAARSAGVPARYVSGYVFSGSDRTTLGSDATHAWVELFIPHSGAWIGFDPTNNVVAADRHVKIATGRDYTDVPPTKGLLRPSRGCPLPGRTDLIVDVRVAAVE